MKDLRIISSIIDLNKMKIIINIEIDLFLTFTFFIKL